MTVDSRVAFWDRTYRVDPDFFGTMASSLARSSLGFLLREAAGGSVVELGTGTGRDLLYFAQNGFEVAGCDSSAVAAREANRRISALREEVPPRTRVAAQDALDFLRTRPPADAHAVYSNLYFNLETDPARLPRLFSAIAHVVRPGGWNVFSVRSVADPWYGRGRPEGADTFDPETGNPPIRYFDEASLRRLIEPEFRVLSLREHPDGAPEFPVVVWSAVTQLRDDPSPSRP